MIRDIILSIRKKPKSTRNNIAKAVAGTFTALVFMIWAFQLPSQTDGAFKQLSADKPQESFGQIFEKITSQASALSGLLESETDEPVPDEQVRPDATELFLNSSTTASSTVMQSTSTDSTYKPPREVRIVTSSSSATTSASATSTPSVQ